MCNCGHVFFFLLEFNIPNVDTQCLRVLNPKQSKNIPKDAIHDLIEPENDLCRKIIETCLTRKTLASSLRSLSWGIARKTASEKVMDNCFLSPHFAHTLIGFNDLWRSVTLTFLFRNRFNLQLSPHCPKMNKKTVWENNFKIAVHDVQSPFFELCPTD